MAMTKKTRAELDREIKEALRWGTRGRGSRRTHGSHHINKSRKSLNTKDRLFMGVYPTGIVYADKAREKAGDYARIAFLPFSTLALEWSPGRHPPELREFVEQDAAKIIARRGQQYQISMAGQTVTLGKR